MLINERKDHDYHAAKKITEMETKLSNLENFKALKIGEEKSDRNEVKNLRKRLKAEENDLAKVKLAFHDLEKQHSKCLVKTEVKICQTDHHLDIPYQIKASLPPIFSSQLCHTTPPIHFLSRSLPRLDKIKWCQPEEYEVDEYDEYIYDQHKQNLKDFYEEARRESKAKRMEESKFSQI